MLVAAIIISVVPVSATAQQDAADRPDGISGFVAVGVGVAPDYEGSNDYQIVPLPIARVGYGNVALELEGLGGRLDISPFEGFGFGPTFNFRPGRDDVEDDRVDALEDVDDAVEIGGFIRYGQPVGLTSRDEAVVRLEALFDVADGHSGIVATLSAGYTFRPIDDLGLTIGTSARWVSDDYADAYFSVSPIGAAASGLAPFNADGGITDVGLNLAATYALTDRWGLLATGGTSFLLGDAADSPVVDDAGSATQFFGGVALTFSF